MNSVNYIIENEQDRLWGITVTTAGHEIINPNGQYPTLQHSGQYYYNPDKGRTLQEYQLVFITEGQGVFQSAHCKETQVSAGTMLLIFPDEWHTYFPDRKKGWTQYWIGFKGKNIDERVRNGILDKSRPLFQVGMSEEIIRVFRQAIEVCNEGKSHYQQLLGGLAEYLLGLVCYLDSNNRMGQHGLLIEKINKARTIMYEHIYQTLDYTVVAKELNMSYSSFRKYFKTYTGLSPAHYFLQLKLQKAKILLRTTDRSVKEIAWELDFSSIAYFSTIFKKHTGVSPAQYRMQ